MTLGVYSNKWRKKDAKSNGKCIVKNEFMRYNNNIVWTIVNISYYTSGYG